MESTMYSAHEATQTISSDQLSRRLHALAERVAEPGITPGQLQMLDWNLDMFEKAISNVPLSAESSGPSPSRLSFDTMEPDSRNVVAGLGEVTEAGARVVVTELSYLTSQLRRRFTETQRVNDVAISIIEQTSQDLAALEDENLDLSNKLVVLQTEFSFLKSQLKSLEARAEPYILQDDVLTTGIARWKRNWAGVDQRVSKDFLKESSTSSS
ncbi:MAG: hypothetical protein M1814_006547 [Vezdaea aestivalis]|nr:MAG: hypothetical protein M1814_006547 [Vezdaea aestivalis]